MLNVKNFIHWFLAYVFILGARFYNALDSAVQRADSLQEELAREIENGRVVRLLTKLNTVVDRAEFNLDMAWAETGDRYMLKLFRDFLFHQVTEDGRPFLDMAHVIANLNRLDAGIPDMIGLMSRDEQNILVVSFSELKTCLERSFGELLSAANSKPKIMA
jgi:PAB-dependent poly(A)-specific ribonuclease subunit 3